MPSASTLKYVAVWYFKQTKKHILSLKKLIVEEIRTKIICSMKRQIDNG